MKRKYEGSDDNSYGEEGALNQGDLLTPISDESNSQSFIKYSQNIDLKDVFKLTMIDGKVYNEENEQILYMVLNKNVKIRRKIDQILRFIKSSEGYNENKEMLFVANNSESIQKLITVIEIIKQKINQLQDYDKESLLNDNNKSSNFKNASIAKLPEYNDIVISGKCISDKKFDMNYNQLNFIDFTLLERKMNVKRDLKKNNNKDKNLYDKDLINQFLKMEKLVKIPVMYIYINIHKDEQLPVKIVSKIKNMVSDGWSIQQS